MRLLGQTVLNYNKTHPPYSHCFTIPLNKEKFTDLPVSHLLKSVCIRPLPGCLSGVVVHIVNTAPWVSSHLPPWRQRLRTLPSSGSKKKNSYLWYRIIDSFPRILKWNNKRLQTVCNPRRADSPGYPNWYWFYYFNFNIRGKLSVIRGYTWYQSYKGCAT